MNMWGALNSLLFFQERSDGLVFPKLTSNIANTMHPDVALGVVFFNVDSNPVNPLLNSIIEAKYEEYKTNPEELKYLIENIDDREVLKRISGDNEYFVFPSIYEQLLASIKYQKKPRDMDTISTVNWWATHNYHCGVQTFDLGNLDLASKPNCYIDYAIESDSEMPPGNPLYYTPPRLRLFFGNKSMLLGAPLGANVAPVSTDTKQAMTVIYCFGKLAKMLKYCTKGYVKHLKRLNIVDIEQVIDYKQFPCIFSPHPSRNNEPLFRSFDMEPYQHKPRCG